MVKAKVWVVNKKIVGVPSLEDFDCIEENLPDCKDGEIIIQAEWLSVDPYMRYRLRSTPVNATPPCGQVSKVIKSDNKKYPVGSYVTGYVGWRSHTHVTKEELERPQMDKGFMNLSFTKLPDLGNTRRSAALGVLGMPGNTAYFGFLELCQPKKGETVVVNGAAGAVGSLVCQIAKIKGCKVIAFAGSEEKVLWLKDMGMDYVFNYKTTNISEVLKSSAPTGIDCYFDNVGGQFSLEVIPHMALFGRISICGAISTYNNVTIDVNNPATTASPYMETNILMKQLKIEGFIVTRWLNRWFEGITQLKEWLEQGKIQHKETVTEGFENMPKAFIGLFKGENIGKAVVEA